MNLRRVVHSIDHELFVSGFRTFFTTLIEIHYGSNQIRCASSRLGHQNIYIVNCKTSYQISPIQDFFSPEMMSSSILFEGRILIFFFFFFSILSFILWTLLIFIISSVDDLNNQCSLTGAAHMLPKTNVLPFSLLTGTSTTFVEKNNQIVSGEPVPNGLHPFGSGTSLGLVSAIQTRTNSRIVISGSSTLCNDNSADIKWASSVAARWSP